MYKLVLLVSVFLGIHLLANAQEPFTTTFRHFKTAQGHSHNDYLQSTPFYKAFNAGMSSIEADVFLKDGKLYVAHTASEIDTAKTFEKLYLQPLVAIMKAEGRPFADAEKSLQLVIDIKENHQNVLALLIALLSPHIAYFDNSINQQAIQIAISGERPEPRDFFRYPKWISFDGLSTVDYSEAEWQRVAMISMDIKSVTDWQGATVPTTKQLDQMRNVIAQAHSKAKLFRFWGNKDTQLVWKVLRDIDVDWINTDDPEGLADFLAAPAVVK